MKYQFWQEGSHAEMIFSESVMREKLEYIHQNPVKRGYVNLPEHWLHSHAGAWEQSSFLVQLPYKIMMSDRDD